MKKQLPVLTGALCACLALLTHPTSAQANDCEVKPFDAYNTAIKRGWKFFCNVQYAGPGAIAHTLLLPEPQGPILCQWRTGLVPQPTPPRGVMRFFVASGDTSTLRNGWRIKSYEITGGQYFQNQHGNSARINAGAMTLDRANHTFNFRLSKLVLTKSGGTCAKALDEAF